MPCNASHSPAQCGSLPRYAVVKKAYALGFATNLIYFCNPVKGVIRPALKVGQPHCLRVHFIYPCALLKNKKINDCYCFYHLCLAPLPPPFCDRVRRPLGGRALWKGGRRRLVCLSELAVIQHKPAPPLPIMAGGWRWRTSCKLTGVSRNNNKKVQSLGLTSDTD